MLGFELECGGGMHRLSDRFPSSSCRRLFISSYLVEPIPMLTRFAPTPSGYLHWGNAFSFVLTWLHARRQKAKILLRIDDLDGARKRPEYVEDVFRSLDWLGLNYDLGPSGPDDFERHFSQKHRSDLYDLALGTLRDNAPIFACTCSRAEINAEPSGQHATACRAKEISLDQPSVCWRLSTDSASESWVDFDGVARQVELHQACRDPVVRRKDLLPAYQLASVVDDTHFGVDFVVRGEDLVVSTAVQRWLSQWMPDVGFTSARYLHHGLVLDPEGRKLSKSAGAISLCHMRAGSPRPEMLFQRMSPLLGLPHPVGSLEQVWEAWSEIHGQNS